MSRPDTAPPLAPGSLQAERYDRLARVLVFGILLAGPLAFGAVEPWAWPVLVALALASLGIWAAGCLIKRCAVLYWSGLHTLGLLLLALGLGQWLAGAVASWFAARNALLSLWGYLALYFVSTQVFSSGQSREQLGWLASGFLLGLGSLAIAQFFTAQGRIYWLVRPPIGSVFGPYVNHNHYAGLMEMLVPLAVATACIRPAGSRGRALAVAAVVVGLCSALLSASRGGLVALLVEGLVLGVVALRLRLLSLRAWAGWTSVLVLLASIGLAYWLWPQGLKVPLASLAELPRAPEVTLGERLIVARDTLRMFASRPGWGYGMGSFADVFPRFRSFAGDALWEHAHNDYAEALAETGLAGALLLVTALWLFFRTTFRNLRERMRTPQGWMPLGCTLGCCGMLVHSLVDFNLHIPANAAWFSVCLAIATAPLAASPASASSAASETR
jgi:O-antigen ligase